MLKAFSCTRDSIDIFLKVQVRQSLQTLVLEQNFWLLMLWSVFLTNSICCWKHNNSGQTLKKILLTEALTCGVQVDMEPVVVVVGDDVIDGQLHSEAIPVGDGQNPGPVVCERVPQD